MNGGDVGLAGRWRSKRRRKAKKPKNEGKKARDFFWCQEFSLSNTFIEKKKISNFGNTVPFNTAFQTY